MLKMMTLVMMIPHEEDIRRPWASQADHLRSGYGTTSRNATPSYSHSA